jgi:hypothetical protein
MTHQRSVAPPPPNCSVCCRSCLVKHGYTRRYTLPQLHASCVLCRDICTCPHCLATPRAYQAPAPPREAAEAAAHYVLAVAGPLVLQVLEAEVQEVCGQYAGFGGGGGDWRGRGEVIGNLAGVPPSSPICMHVVHACRLRIQHKACTLCPPPPHTPHTPHTSTTPPSPLHTPLQAQAYGTTLQAVDKVRPGRGERLSCDLCASGLALLVATCPDCGWELCADCSKRLRKQQQQQQQQQQQGAAAGSQAAAAGGAASPADRRPTCPNPLCPSVGGQGLPDQVLTPGKRSPGVQKQSQRRQQQLRCLPAGQLVCQPGAAPLQLRCLQSPPQVKKLQKWSRVS